MDFIENIKQSVGEFFPKEPSYKAVFLGDDAVYFQNVTKIISFTSEKITLSLKKGGVDLVGENLYIKKYCMGDVVICGKITSMQRF